MTFERTNEEQRVDTVLAQYERALVRDGKHIALPLDQYESVCLSEGTLIIPPHWFVFESSRKTREEPRGELAYWFRRPSGEKHDECGLPQLHKYHCIILESAESMKVFMPPPDITIPPQSPSIRERPYSLAEIPEKLFSSAVLIGTRRPSSLEDNLENVREYRDLVGYLNKTCRFEKVPEKALRQHEYLSDYEEKAI